MIGTSAQDNAGIFFYGRPLSPEQIIAAARGASAESHLDGNLTRVTATWPDVMLVITIDPSWNRDVQLKGMRNWIGKFGAASPATKEFLAHLGRTTTGYGSMITPAYDPEGKGRCHAVAFAGADRWFLLLASVLLRLAGPQDHRPAGRSSAVGPTSRAPTAALISTACNQPRRRIAALAGPRTEGARTGRVAGHRLNRSRPQDPDPEN
jgi:hypothetical protein